MRFDTSQSPDVCYYFSPPAVAGQIMSAAKFHRLLRLA